ncbi:MAG: diaminopimelate decarboxylase [Gammaproteobacteria bacterium]|nr:diaminopimelate decarboxylase [Gammaproteobacteria bacterium]
MSPIPAPPWWQRDDLCYQNGQLYFAGHEVNQLAKLHSTPTFFYNAQRLNDNIARLHTALQHAGMTGKYRVLYAMKANRYAPLLTHLKSTGLVGIDACSPNEVDHAISCGFGPDEISFTNTSLSRSDYDRLNRIEGLSMQCDSLTCIRKWGELGGGRNIGIRINPAIGLGRADNDKLQYAGADTTKFGIYREQFAEAIALAKQYDLSITKIHFHTGCGYLTPQLDHWEDIIQTCMWFVDQLADTVEVVNVGGGLGVPHTEHDMPLDLDLWAAIVARNFKDKKVIVEIEPGDYIVKDSGILLLTVNTVEWKRDKTFVGVNGGFNIALEPAVYGLPFQPVPAMIRKGEPMKVTIAGHINEALDIFSRDTILTPIEEDDVLVLINAGAYSTSMASNHCMRGEFKEFLLY